LVAGALAANAAVLMGASPALTSTPLRTWYLDAKPVPSIAWRAVIFAGGRWVALGNGGALATSTNGTNWTERAIPGGQWDAVAYGRGRFVALSGSGSGVHELTSLNGVNWSAVPLYGGGWTRVAYGNGRFVAVSAAGRISTSANGITWTTPFSRVADHFTGVAYGNGRFEVVDGAQGDALVSVDGVRWAFYTAARPGLRWGSVAYGNGNFVAVDGAGTGLVATTVMGYVWTLHPYGPVQRLEATTFGCNSFLALGEASGAGNNVLTSPTGSTWVATPVPADAGSAWSAAAYGAGRFVAVDTAGTIAWTPSARYCGPSIDNAPQQVSGNVHSGMVWTYMHPPPPNGGGAPTSYRVTITDGTTTKYCSAPVYFEPNCKIFGLLNHHSYEVTTQARNGFGYSVPSDPEFVVPVPVWSLAAGTSAPVQLASTPLTVQVTGVIANSLGIYPIALVSVQVGSQHLHCWPNPFGECQLTISHPVVGPVALRASYTGYGRAYRSGVGHVYLAAVTLPGASLGVGQSALVQIRGAVPRSLLKVTFGPRAFQTILNTVGAGTLHLIAPATAGTFTITVANDGVVLEHSSVTVHS
jgi:hypothetical protein